MRLIDADALTDNIYCSDELHAGTEVILKYDVLTAPTVDAAQVAIKVEKYKAFGSTGDWYRCPRCGIDITGHSILRPFYCRNCGQRLDWSNGKDDTQ